MTEVSRLNDIVTKVARIQSVFNVFVASRAGVYTVGNTPEMTERAMFSAITAMMLGAAEQLSSEMGDDLNHVFLKMNKTCMIIMGAGPKHIIGIEINPEVDPMTILAEAKKIIANS